MSRSPSVGCCDGDADPRGRESGRGTPMKVWQRWLAARAERTAYPAVAGQPRMTLELFARREGTRGRFVAQCAKHVVAVVDGVVHDDGRPDGARCVYAAW